MLEETVKAAGHAAGTITETVWGALLLLSWVIFAVVFYVTSRYLTHQLKEEQTAHQATREARLTELKSNNQMATGMLALQDTQKALLEEQQKQTSLIFNALLNQRKTG